MHQLDWYFRQKVLESDLDSTFGYAEDADQAVIKDMNVGRDASNPSEYGGILWGLNTSFSTGMIVDTTSGAGYDESGQRIYTSQTYQVTLTKLGHIAIGAGGVPTGATSDPGAGKECWLTLYIEYDRKLTAPVYDGYNNEVYSNRLESFKFYVAQGDKVLIGNLLDIHKPPRESSKLLLADIHITNAGSLAIASVDTTRREVFFKVTASGSPAKSITAESVRPALRSLLETINDHIGGSDKHDAADILFTPGETWRDGTGGSYGAATDAGGGIDGIVEDLARLNDGSIPAAIAGTKRLGAHAVTGSLATPTQASPASLPSSSLHNALAALLTAVNGRVFRGGDNGIAGALIPSGDATALGSDAKSWDLYGNHLKVKGNLKSNLMPDVTASYDIGDSTHQVNETHVATASVYTLLELVAANAAIDVPTADSSAFCITTDAKADYLMNIATDQIDVPGALPIILQKPTCIWNASQPTDGVDGLRIISADSGLHTASPKLPLGFGTTLQGGMNEWGVPIMSHHFRDDFFYNENIVTDYTKLPPYYAVSASAIGCVVYAPSPNPGALYIVADVAENVSLVGPEALHMNSTTGFNWTFAAMVQVENLVSSGTIVIGLGSGTAADRDLYFEAAPATSANWRFKYGNGAASTYVDTGIAIAGGGLTKVLIIANGSNVIPYLYNANGTFGDGVTKVYAINTAGATHSCKAMAVCYGAAAAFTRLYLFYWEWFNKYQPNLGKMGVVPPI